jgi:protein SCO1/2
VKLRYALVAVVGGVLLAVMTACSSSGGSSPSSGSSAKASGLNDNTGGGMYQGIGLVPPRPRPAFTLTDTSGATYPFATKTQGKTTLLFFGYTNCPDICPETMIDIAQALRKLPAATQKKVTVAFVSTDVKRDTGAVITEWLKNFTPHTYATFVGLRGTQAQVDAAQAASHILIAEDDGQTHSTQVLLFGPDDYARDSFVYNDNGEADQMAHDIPLVVKGQA